MPKSKFTLTNIAEGIFGAASVAASILTPMLRGWRNGWGATDGELQRSLPGDDNVPNPKILITRAITINAPPAKVWPWVVQIGYQRAGWYSYDALEALVGAADFVDGHSANRIIPELQNPQVGETIYMHPSIGYPVVGIEPERALILHDRKDLQTDQSFELSDTMPEKYINLGWVYSLEKTGESATRLIVRSRYDYNPGLANTIIWRGITESLHFVMERKTMLGIKKRAESG